LRYPLLSGRPKAVDFSLLSNAKGRNRLALARFSQANFYKAFLMARSQFNPRDFGVDLDREEFIDQMCDDFNTIYRGQWTIDELCLHPREALHFCDDVRRKHHYFDLPDDIILRVIMARRKNPTC
jgi:hypothetical protein